MNNDCCLSKILLLIDKLQKNSEQKDCVDNTCSRPFLGIVTQALCFNTRPITLYNCQNNLIGIDYTYDNNGTILTGRSTVFRVEKVNKNSCLCSLLIPNPDTTNLTNPFISINQTVTINLDCVCALKCLQDTIVNL